MKRSHSWVVHFAESVTPAEVDAAPFIFEAYLAGGKKRKELFHSDSASMPGAFWPDTSGIAVLPYILEAIAKSADWLSDMLTLDCAAQLLTSINHALTIHERFSIYGFVASTPTKATPLVLSVADTLSAELRQRGIPEEQADSITLKVIRTLLTDPESSRAFVTELKNARQAK
jgi:hypothetical protein